MAPTLYHTGDTPTFAGFQSEPTGRGTIGIIWTCLSTILLSSWSSYHSHVYDPSKCLKCEAIDSYITRFAIAFLIPDVAAAVSVTELHDALQLRRIIRQVGGPEFANFSLSQAFVFLRGGAYQRLPGLETPELVDGNMLVQLVKSRRLPLSSLPTVDEISDKSKRDWTLKSLSIIQTAWFIVSIIARLSRGYPISLFEIITAACAFCGIIEFICWFQCPQGIALPFIIIKPDIPRTSNSPVPSENDESRQEPAAHASVVSENATTTDASSGQSPNRELSTCEQPHLPTKAIKRWASFANQPVEFRETSANVLMVTWTVISVLFSSIHIAAWHYSFPSATEAWIWRGGALALIVASPFMAFALPRCGQDDPDKVSYKSIWGCVLVSSSVLHTLARLAILAVTFMSFRKAPASLYETPSWTQYWPHI